MSVIQNNLLMTPEGYQISRSVRLRSSASAYLNRTFPSAGNKNKWTYSGWFKMGIGTNFRFIGSNTTVFGTASALGELYLDGSNRLTFFQYTGGTTYSNVISTQVFRDPSAWYHIVCIYDDAQATASNRVRMFVNGSEITSFATAAYPSQNFTGFINEPKPHVIGAYAANGGYYGDGYLTEVNFIDGQALTPSSFGETDAVTGVWKPKKYAGTYGTNGFYLNFSDNSAATAAAIGKDSSGNGNNWTPNNISVTSGVTYDSMLDVPTMWADGGNGRGNYAVLNPISSNTSMTITGANLNVTSSVGSQAFNAYSSIAVLTGKWYVEVTINTGSDADMIGVCPSTLYSGSARFDQSTGAVGYYMDGRKFVPAGGSAYGASYTTGAVIGIALDMDAQTVTFYKNGTSQGTISSSLTAGVSYYFTVGDASAGTGINQSWNFGQRPFAYTPPTGFKALNTQNLPDSTIKKGNAYFDATLYTGNHSTNAVVNSGGFQPDLIWLKDRTAAAAHVLFDSVRGVGGFLSTNNTTAEDTTQNYAKLNSFNSNGFTLGASTLANDLPNYSGDSFVGWQWKESVSAGFDIVTYTGTGSNTTVAHNLGVAPKMMIVKQRNSANSWIVYQASLGATQYLRLETTAAAAAATAIWNDTSPTSSVFTVGTSGTTNGSAQTYVAYLFAEVAGFSRFGSYVGNGSADGPFVYCGFRPRFVLVKGSSNASSWQLFDTSRPGYNANDNTLWADLSSAEGTGTARIDLLSNGFKVRAPAGTDPNVSSQTYIYAAFAENPFKNSLAR